MGLRVFSGPVSLVIIMVTEILPKNTGSVMTANGCLVEGYNIYSNMENLTGRGIAICINEVLLHLVSSVGTRSNYKESIWLLLRLKGKDCLKLGCVYRSPFSNASNIENLTHLLNEVISNDPSHLLCGDFNCKSINWEENTADRQGGKFFFDWVKECFLDQYVTAPTRYHEGQMSGTLDLIMTNEERMITNLMYLLGIGLSDHICPMFDLTWERTQSKQQTQPNTNTTGETMME